MNDAPVFAPKTEFVPHPGPAIGLGRGNQESGSRDLTVVEHWHDFTELVIMAQGTATHCIDGAEYPVSAGDAFVIQGETCHYFRDRQDMVHLNFAYDPVELALPEDELRRIPGYHAMFVLEPNYRKQHQFRSRLRLGPADLAWVDGMFDQLHKERWSDEPGSEVLVRSYFLELVVFLSRRYTRTATTEGKSLLRLGEVIGCLERDPERNWTIDELAAIAHMSPSNLIRVFKRATGSTPISYAIELRVKRAMRLLVETDLTVHEIAFRVGFQDSNYLCRQFRKITGISPGDYRKRNQNH